MADQPPTPPKPPGIQLQLDDDDCPRRVHEPRDDQPQRERVRARLRVPAARRAGRPRCARASSRRRGTPSACCWRCRRTSSATRSASAPSSSAATSRSFTSTADCAAGYATARLEELERAGGGVEADARAVWKRRGCARRGRRARRRRRGCRAPPSRSARTASASGALPSFSAQPTKSPSDDAGEAIERAGEPELRELAIDAVGALADLLERGARRLERQRPWRADQAREHLEVAADERPFGRVRPRIARKPVSGGGGDGDSQARTAPRRRRRAAGRAA